MKKTLLIIASALMLPLTATAQNGEGEKNEKAPAKAAVCEKPKCATECTKGKKSAEECQKKCEEYFEKAFTEHDKNKDGKLDKAEFKALMVAAIAKKKAAKAKCCPSKKCDTECKEEKKEKAAAE